MRSLHLNFLPVLLLSTLLSLSAQASFKLATYNIRNFDYDERSRVFTNKQHLVKTIKNLDADFIGVQEINKTRAFDEMIQRNFLGRYKTVFTECGGAHDQRLGFVYDRAKFDLVEFKQDLRTVKPNQQQQRNNRGRFDCRDGSRPLAVGHFREKATNRHIITISLHLKSGGRESSIKKRFRQIKIINKLINEKRAQGFEHFIVLGDFNTTEYNKKGAGRDRFVNAVNQMRLKDHASNLKCTAYWWGGRDDKTQYPSSLDHILVSSSLQSSKTRSAELHGHCARLRCGATRESQMGISFDEVSDHCPIALTL